MCLIYQVRYLLLKSNIPWENTNYHMEIIQGFFFGFFVRLFFVFGCYFGFWFWFFFFRKTCKYYIFNRIKLFRIGIIFKQVVFVKEIKVWNTMGVFFKCIWNLNSHRQYFYFSRISKRPYYFPIGINFFKVHLSSDR